jgi:TPR repeat protein
MLDAANGGYPDAQERMGKFYEKGKGVGEDRHKAFEYYQKAAKQGHERAKGHLRRLNEMGDAPPGWNEK